MTPRAAPIRARLCRCERPLLADDTCLRCGRPPTVAPEPAASPPQARRDAWTRPQVAHAFRAFAFFRGRAPVAADWSQRMADWPTLATVEALFGSVAEAARMAGIEPQVRRTNDVH
jgi:hypothetical protein